MEEAEITLTLWEAQTLAWFASQKYRENSKKVWEDSMKASEAHLVEFEVLRDKLADLVGRLKPRETG
jgi:hypothetical protein